MKSGANRKRARSDASLASTNTSQQDSDRPRTTKATTPSRKQIAERQEAALSAHAGSSVRSQRLEFSIGLPSCYLGGNELRGVEEALDSGLLKYNEHIGGALLAYDELELSSGHGLIVDEQPDVVLRCSLRATYFAPTPGTRIRAVATSVTAGHIALITAGVFQVVLPVVHLPKRFIFDKNRARFVSRTSSDEIIERDSSLSVICVRVVGRDALWHIEAKLEDERMAEEIVTAKPVKKSIDSAVVAPPPSKRARTAVEDDDDDEEETATPAPRKSKKKNIVG